MEIFYDIKNTVLAETILTFGIFAMFFFSIISDKLNKNFLFAVSMLVLLLAFGSTFFINLSYINYIFSGVISVNSFAFLFKKLILVGAIFSLWLSDKYLQSLNRNRGEFHILLLIATLGAILLSSSDNLLMMFVSLEMLGISSYLLCGFSKNNKFSTESALKYFVTGSVASAVLLYGVSLVYGLSSSTQFEIISHKLLSLDYIAILAGVLIVCGICFKIAAVPFYSWASDVYKGAPIGVAAFLSVVPKLAGFAILIRMLTVVFNNIWILYPFVAIISILTMGVANILALKENNLRKIMAYSSIAQAGYVLAVVALGSALSISSALFYLITYLFMNFAAWGSIAMISDDSDLKLQDISGLISKNPVAATCLTVSVLSLAGLPFSIGFFSKFYMFQSLAFAGFVILPFLLVILINILISFAYYFGIIRRVFSQDVALFDFVPNSKIKIATVLAAIFILISGFFSSRFIEISQNAALDQITHVRDGN